MKKVKSAAILMLTCVLVNLHTAVLSDSKSFFSVMYGNDFLSFIKMLKLS